MPRSILDIDTVKLIDNDDCIEIIDQTKLPEEIKIKKLREQEDIRVAIEKLEVRGAPAIGITGAFGLYLAAKEIAGNRIRDYKDKKNHDAVALNIRFFEDLSICSDYLNASRPTAVDLSWGLKRVYDAAVKYNEKYSVNAHTNMIDYLHGVLGAMKDEAMAIYNNNIEMCRKIGEYGLSLIKPGDGILTHCNAGKLATVKYGTATAPMYLAHEQNYDLRIFCDETRPLLQGARLTAFELSSAGMDVTLQCDNMSSSLLKTGAVNAVFVGCDRVAANGDVANKIGTSLLAIAAKRYNVPFYVCAPSSTIDLNTPTGDEIVIEQRDPDEVTEKWYKTRMAPDDINVYNPAFDVTDADLITAIITENGIIKAPFTEGLKNAVNAK